MIGVTDTTSSAPKRCTSPRPPAVGEEVKKFHDTPQRFLEPYKNWNMECQSKASFVAESTADHRSVTPTCSENFTESAEGLNASSNPSPPASYKWAQSLHCLLEDNQGVALFQKFLRQEGQDMKCFYFWFACKGVKKTDPNDRDGLIKLIKLVFEKKVRRISAISDETKKEIRQKLSSNTEVDDTIFDAAQREVESYMMKTTYPNFLRSDLYIQHLGGWQQSEHSPEKERDVTPEPLNFLPTVHEDSELHIASNKIPPLTKANLLQRNKVSSVYKFKPEGPAGYLLSPYSNYTSYHSKYGSYLPASAQDSELQSLSSDAQTDDTVSVTDGSSVDFPMHSRSRQKRPPKISKHSISKDLPINKDKLSHDSFIPRTDRLPLDATKPLSQQDFHEKLCRKLNKVLEDSKLKEKVAEKMKSIESAENLKPEAFSFPCGRPSHKSNPNQVFDSRFFDPSEENNEDILDQHISRVWDSGQHTPASECRSPPVSQPSVDEKSHVPLRSSGYSAESSELLATSHRQSQASQFTVPNSIKFRREHDTQSTDSAMCDYVSDDNIPLSCYRSQYSAAGNSEPVDYSRRSKEHSKRYASKKFSSMTDSGISLAIDPVPCHSKVTHWLEAKRMTEQEREQCTWRNSSTSPVLSRSSISRKTVGYNNCRSGGQDVGFSQWSGAPPQLSQDRSMSGNPSDLTLLEARRRLDIDDNRAKMKLKSTSGGRNSYDTSRMKSSYDDGLSHRKTNRKSCSLNVIEAATANTVCNDSTVIGYTYGRHSVPYLSKLSGKNITLRQFKTLISKKGNFRYFFKTASNDFGTGVVFEEVTDDCKVLPMWEGKVFCVIESMDENSSF